MSYAELYCLSNFSFQRGASSADELFERAKALGYQALAITDEMSLAGIVRALEASERTALRLIVGAECRFEDGLGCVLLVRNYRGYQCLCRLISEARLQAQKGSYRLPRALFEQVLRAQAAEADLVVLLLAERTRMALHGEDLAWLSRCILECRIAVSLHRAGDDQVFLEACLALAAQTRVSACAVGAVRMHKRGRRALADVMRAIALNSTVAACGLALARNAEAHLRDLKTLASLYPEALLRESLEVAKLCCFSLREIRYQYPHELVPAGMNATSWLKVLTQEGMQRRWPRSMPSGDSSTLEQCSSAPTAVVRQIEHELSLIAELSYESYFLTVADIVRFARSRGILCQGRGSAANSAVCFCLGITEVDPARMSMLFERFISKERNEPPDIDVDFEHERREEVFQYIYRKYGRQRAALAATVICYRPRSALRDVAKALGLGQDQLEALSGVVSGWSRELRAEDGSIAADVLARMRERGLNPDSRLLHKVLVLAGELMGFPRHLSQHTGGFVIAEQPLHTLVPIENAAMPERTVLQWDKDDLDTMGLLKVDCLALGMLSCLKRCLDLLGFADLSAIPSEDAQTYAMIQRADTVGVFQIESRAQMSMLPRLKPKCFYDLVIEVAIVRPGPIQGKMVHPYLRRREGSEPVDYPSADLKRVFERTLGVPIFQEQVMQLAIVAAGFSAGEADQLRRAMAAWKRRGGLEHYRQRILSGMHERGYELSFAEQVFEQIKGFGSYGFPESHAASFALLVYASCYLKCHYPVHFACALLNAQPMGFYAPAQIIADLKRHGFSVLPVDVLVSAWHSSIEMQADKPALRLGFHQIMGFNQAAAERVIAWRKNAVSMDLNSLSHGAQLNAKERRQLAAADALAELLGHRHQAYWAVQAVQASLPLAGLHMPQRSEARLATPSPQAELFADYASTGLSLKQHPLQLLRSRLCHHRYLHAGDLLHAADGKRVRVAGLVTLRQRPSTASGVTFVTLEDEHGMINLVVWSALFESQRQVLLDSSILGVDGTLQSAQGVIHVVARRLHCLDAWLKGFNVRSRDFH
jgi:error-prone DNA polymerase